MKPISADDYMQHYAAAHDEWVNGVLISMSPISSQHDEITGFLYLLLRAYFEQKPFGKVKREPFVMKLDKTTSSSGQTISPNTQKSAQWCRQ